MPKRLSRRDFIKLSTGIRPHPWQTDTCIGSWHYSRAIAEQNKYKTVGQVVDMLIDIVSKNGNLMLSVPVRGDGTIDEHEVTFLEGMSTWMKSNGEGIFGSRPWKVYGEGPSTGETPERGDFGGARDVRSRIAHRRSTLKSNLNGSCTKCENGGLQFGLSL